MAVIPHGAAKPGQFPGVALSCSTPREWQAMTADSTGYGPMPPAGIDPKQVFQLEGNVEQ